MCGACGRTVTADPVFPAGRTTRGNLIAARMIGELCASAAGRATVVGQADRFIVSAPGRQQTLCATVGEAWDAVFSLAPSSALLLDAVPEELEEKYRGSGAQQLLGAVVAAGREAARAFCPSSQTPGSAPPLRSG